MESPTDLLGRIQLGEDSSLELKAVEVAGGKVRGPRREDLAAEIAAFANSRTGGTLVLGVEDGTRRVTGIPDGSVQEVVGLVSEVCNDSIHPPVVPTVRVLKLPGKSGSDVVVVCIEVLRSLYIHRVSGRYFWRVGSSKREIPPEVLARLLHDRSQSQYRPFDESPVPGAAFDSLAPGLCHRFVSSGSGPVESKLAKLGLLVRDDDGRMCASVAGVLLCSEEPETHLRSAFIQAVHYSSERSSRDYQIDAQDCTGPLDRQIDLALKFLLRNMKVSAVKDPARRETPQYSVPAVFEALVNAVAHRDYSVGGSHIRLHMFPDRIELFSPGSLPNTLTVDTLEYRQFSRNQLIVSMLAKCPAPETHGISRSYYMDRRGDGVPIIMDETLKLSGKSPEYTVLNESELRLVIPAAAPPWLAKS